MGKLAVFLRFGAVLRHYNRVSGGSKTIIAHESKFAKVFVDDPHLLTRSDLLFLSALQQENGQFFVKNRLIEKRYFLFRKKCFEIHKHKKPLPKALPVQTHHFQKLFRDGHLFRIHMECQRFYQVIGAFHFGKRDIEGNGRGERSSWPWSPRAATTSR